MGKVDPAPLTASNRQLEAKWRDFWFIRFNVLFANKDADKWLLTSYVRDTIRPHTMGKFQDLLIATAKSPAMLFYLDNWQSVDPVAFQRHQPEIAMRRRPCYPGCSAGIISSDARHIPQSGRQPVRARKTARVLNNQPQERGLNENLRARRVGYIR